MTAPSDATGQGGRVLVRSRGAPALAWCDRAEAAGLAEAAALEPPVDGLAYGVILNTHDQVMTLDGELHAPPYRAPPRAPVLYVKPPNTYLRSGGDTEVPAHLDELEVVGALAAVFERPAARVSPQEALSHLLGYTCALEICEPHTSLHRPPIRQRCRDGFLPLGPWIVPPQALTHPDRQEIITRVNGAEACRWSTADLVRGAAQLIADVSEFMTLEAGDALVLGLPGRGARARAGDRVEMEIADIGRLSCRLVQAPVIATSGRPS